MSVETAQNTAQKPKIPETAKTEQIGAEQKTPDQRKIFCSQRLGKAWEKIGKEAENSPRKAKIFNFLNQELYFGKLQKPQIPISTASQQPGNNQIKPTIGFGQITQKETPKEIKNPQTGNPQIESQKSNENVEVINPEKELQEITQKISILEKEIDSKKAQIIRIKELELPESQKILNAQMYAGYPTKKGLNENSSDETNSLKNEIKLLELKITSQKREIMNDPKIAEIYRQQMIANYQKDREIIRANNSRNNPDSFEAFIKAQQRMNYARDEFSQMFGQNLDNEVSPRKVESNEQIPRTIKANLDNISAVPRQVGVTSSTNIVGENLTTEIYTNKDSGKISFGSIKGDNLVETEWYSQSGIESVIAHDFLTHPMVVQMTKDIFSGKQSKLFPDLNKSINGFSRDFGETAVYSFQEVQVAVLKKENISEAKMVSRLKEELSNILRAGQYNNKIAIPVYILGHLMGKRLFQSKQGQDYLNTLKSFNKTYGLKYNENVPIQGKSFYQEVYLGKEKDPNNLDKLEKANKDLGLKFENGSLVLENSNSTNDEYFSNLIKQNPTKIEEIKIIYEAINTNIKFTNDGKPIFSFEKNGYKSKNEININHSMLPLENEGNLLDLKSYESEINRIINSDEQLKNLYY